MSNYWLTNKDKSNFNELVSILTALKLTIDSTLAPLEFKITNEIKELKSNLVCLDLSVKENPSLGVWIASGINAGIMSKGEVRTTLEEMGM